MGVFPRLEIGHFGAKKQAMSARFQAISAASMKPAEDLRFTHRNLGPVPASHGPLNRSMAVG